MNPRRDVSKSGAASHFLFPDSLRKTIYGRVENNFNFQIISVDRLGELSEWEVESGRMVMMGGLGKCCVGCEGAGGNDIFKCCEDILVKCSVLVLFFQRMNNFARDAQVY